jgi:hypothetical protein
LEPARWFYHFSCLIGRRFSLKVIGWLDGRGISLKGNTLLFLPHPPLLAFRFCPLALNPLPRRSERRPVVAPE